VVIANHRDGIGASGCGPRHRLLHIVDHVIIVPYTWSQ
jgi:hypothetical protein